MFYSNILVAYDGSELGNKALDYVIELSTINNQVKIHVVHVVSIPHVAPYAYVRYYDNEEISKSMTEEGRKILEKAEEKLSKANIKGYDTQLLDGRPSEEILNYASKEKCDLIVMGSRGLSDIKELFLGSVSHHIVQRSEIPVFIIK